MSEKKNKLLEYDKCFFKIINFIFQIWLYPYLWYYAKIWVEPQMIKYNSRFVSVNTRFLVHPRCDELKVDNFFDRRNC